jgi:hypothetical protein
MDETVLPNLTADELKELGIMALGHRRKLLDAIAALRENATKGRGRRCRSSKIGMSDLLVALTIGTEIACYQPQ